MLKNIIRVTGHWSLVHSPLNSFGYWTLNKYYYYYYYYYYIIK